LKDLDYFILVLLGLSVGITIASQAGINSTLRGGLQSPVQAALISFLIGAVLLGVISWSQGHKWSGANVLASLPWWAWLGGVLGAFNVAMSIFLAPRLGALLLAGSVITGQIVASLLLDKFGWLGYPKIDLDSKRLLGALLMLLGLYLVASR
jgi:transporter family-2 protein